MMAFWRSVVKLTDILTGESEVLMAMNIKEWQYVRW